MGKITPVLMIQCQKGPKLPGCNLNFEFNVATVGSPGGRFSPLRNSWGKDTVQKNRARGMCCVEIYRWDTFISRVPPEDPMLGVWVWGPHRCGCVKGKED